MPMAGKAVLVQYIALRGDLHRTQKWPVGALVAQGCHACTAVIHTHRDNGNVVQYLSDLDRMHKVVLEVDTTINQPFESSLLSVCRSIS